MLIFGLESADSAGALSLRGAPLFELGVTQDDPATPEYLADQRAGLNHRKGKVDQTRWPPQNLPPAKYRRSS